MPKGKYYEYQIKRSALDHDYLSGNIDDFQYARESLDLDLEYEPYILAQTINSEVAKKQHEKEDNWGINGFFLIILTKVRFFITLILKILLLNVVPKNQSGSGEWVMVTYLLGLYFKPQLINLSLPYLEILQPFL